MGGYAIKIDFGTTTKEPPPPAPSERAHDYERDEDAKPRRSLYISFPRDINLPTERELFDEFSKFSRVGSVKIAPELHYAFVNFDFVDDAQVALDIYYSLHFFTALTSQT